MRTSVTDDDEGKPVVYEGDQVGRVVEVTDGTAHVDPDPGLTETVLSKLGWADAGEDAIPLHGDSIAEVTDEAVRIDVAE